MWNTGGNRIKTFVMLLANTQTKFHNNNNTFRAFDVFL